MYFFQTMQGLPLKCIWYIKMLNEKLKNKVPTFHTNIQVECIYEHFCEVFQE